MRKSIAIFFVVAIAVITPLLGLAAPITVPTGLNPGDQYRLAFLTSTSRDATSSDIADYNAFVTTAADSVAELAALGTTWKAIASTTAVDARDNTGTNPNMSAGVPIYDVASQLIASSNSDLWDGSIATPLKLTESGEPNSDVFLVWTGSTAAGMRHVPLGANTSTTAGFSVQSNSQWMISTLWAPGSPLPLYALSDVLMVVPEPGMMVLAALGLIGFAAWGWRRKR